MDVHHVSQQEFSGCEPSRPFLIGRWIWQSVDAFTSAHSSYAPQVFSNNSIRVSIACRWVHRRWLWLQNEQTNECRTVTTCCVPIAGHPWKWIVVWSKMVGRRLIAVKTDSAIDIVKISKNTNGRFKTWCYGSIHLAANPFQVVIMCIS